MMKTVFAAIFLSAAAATFLMNHFGRTARKINKRNARK